MLRVIGIACACIIMAAGGSFAAMQAVTEDGRTVILEESGRWYYKPASGFVATGQEVPKDATERVVGRRGTYAIHFNPAKWQLTTQPSNQAAEFELDHTDGDGYALVIFERLDIPLSTLRDIFIENARGAAPNARIVREGKRTVNGAEVLAVQLEGTMSGIDFVYWAYLYAGPAGTIQVVTYTGTALFDEYQPDFTDLLNGFTPLK